MKKASIIAVGALLGMWLCGCAQYKVKWAQEPADQTQFLEVSVGVAVKLWWPVGWEYDRDPVTGEVVSTTAETTETIEPEPEPEPTPND